MEDKFLSHIGEITVTFSEDEVESLNALIESMKVAERALKKAMPALEKVTDPYA